MKNMMNGLSIFIILVLCASTVWGLDTFGLNLYKNLVQKHENIILSPASIKQCLTIAALGSHGQTSNEIKEAINYPSNISDNELLVNLKNNVGSYLMAYRMYVHYDRTLNEKFKSSIESKIGYDVLENINFKNSLQAVKSINQWVSNQTDSKISNLMHPDQLSSDTKMVLLNVIYFKNAWQTRFPNENSFIGQFYSNPNDFQDVEFMQLKADFRFNRFNKLDAACVELPYMTPGISMFLLLPNTRNGLKHLLEKLNTIDIDVEVINNLVVQKVEVTIPKFKAEFQIDLTETLKTIGARAMFTESADFRKLLTNPEPLKVSSVVHKASIEINEDGVIAVGATGGILIARCAPICEHFEADHPFFYFIYDRNTKTMLFMGQYKNP